VKPALLKLFHGTDLKHVWCHGCKASQTWSLNVGSTSYLKEVIRPFEALLLIL
jgi:hypothetical protein